MFFAYLSGGGGCDYTMDCNKKLVKLNANTWSQAEIEAANLYDENDNFVDEITILEVDKTVEFDVKGHKAKQREIARKEAAEAEEKQARDQYEQLKERFEK